MSWSIAISSATAVVSSRSVRAGVSVIGHSWRYVKKQTWRRLHYSPLPSSITPSFPLCAETHLFHKYFPPQTPYRTTDFSYSLNDSRIFFRFLTCSKAACPRPPQLDVTQSIQLWELRAKLTPQKWRENVLKLLVHAVAPRQTYIRNWT